MPTYRIQSGALDERIETPDPASPEALAIMAIDRAKPKELGMLIEISGGEFCGDDTAYTSTERVLRLMGRMGNDRVEGRDAASSRSVPSHDGLGTGD